MNFLLSYETLISKIVSLCPAQDKFAHMSAGLGVWLISAMVLRKPLHSRWPLLIVLLLELGNECVDRLAHKSWRLNDTIGDAIATWFWPVLLTLALANLPLLRGGAVAPAPLEGDGAP